MARVAASMAHQWMPHRSAFGKVGVEVEVEIDVDVEKRGAGELVGRQGDEVAFVKYVPAAAQVDIPMLMMMMMMPAIVLRNSTKMHLCRLMQQIALPVRRVYDSRHLNLILPALAIQECFSVSDAHINKLKPRTGAAIPTAVAATVAA